MVLRFQESDEVDRAAKANRSAGLDVFVMVLIVGIWSLTAWLDGDSLANYKKSLPVLVVFLLVYWLVNWLVAPYYHEFRIRTKEIDGKVSAIEKAVNGSSKGYAELLERLTSIEEKLAEIQDARRI